MKQKIQILKRILNLDVEVSEHIYNFITDKESEEEFSENIERINVFNVLSESGIDYQEALVQYNDIYKNDPLFKQILKQYFKIRKEESYPLEFYNPILRESISTDQDNKCKICGDILNQYKQLHHIDYDKQNCKRNNLVYLCPRCHGKTNYNREFWKNYLHS